MSCFVISNEQMDAILYPLDAHRLKSCSLQSFYNGLYLGDFTDEKLSFLGEEFFIVIDLVNDYFNDFLGRDGYYLDYKIDVDIEDGNITIACAWISGS